MIVILRIIRIYLRSCRNCRWWKLLIKKLLRNLKRRRILLNNMIKILMLLREINERFRVEGNKLIIGGSIVKKISLSDVCNIIYELN